LRDKLLLLTHKKSHRNRNYWWPWTA